MNSRSYWLAEREREFRFTVYRAFMCLTRPECATQDENQMAPVPGSHVLCGCGVDVRVVGTTEGCLDGSLTLALFRSLAARRCPPPVVGACGRASRARRARRCVTGCRWQVRR